MAAEAAGLRDKASEIKPGRRGRKEKIQRQTSDRQRLLPEEFRSQTTVRQKEDRKKTEREDTVFPHDIHGDIHGAAERPYPSVFWKGEEAGTER